MLLEYDKNSRHSSRRNRVKNGFYRGFFKSCLEIINLSVAVLAIVGLLVSVGFFKLRIEPKIMLLEPTYGFDMSRLLAACRWNTPTLTPPSEWLRFTNQYVLLKKSSELILSNSRQFVFFKTISETDLDMIVVKNTDPLFSFFQLGALKLGSKQYLNMVSLPNFAANRTEKQKRDAVFLPIFWDEKFFSRERHIEFEANSVDENPLLIIQALMPHTEAPQFGDAARLDAISDATFIHSIVSIANTSSEPIENIRLSVANSIFSGGVSLVGWSDVPQYVEALEKNRNYHITIERLDPNQSIEFVFSGHKTLHESDLGIASSWTLDKSTVAAVVFIILLLAMVFYFGDYLHAITKSIVCRILVTCKLRLFHGNHK